MVCFHIAPLYCGRFTDVSLPCGFAPGDFAPSHWRFRYSIFSHLSDPRRFATSLLFAIARLFTLS